MSKYPWGRHLFPGKQNRNALGCICLLLGFFDFFYLGRGWQDRPEAMVFRLVYGHKVRISRF